MRKILLYLLLGLLWGCSASRKLTTTTEQTTTEKTEADVRTEGYRKTDAASARTATTATTETGEEVIVRREYDTTRPADTITGKPPLKNETITYKNASRDTRQQQTDTTSQKQQEQVVTQDNAHLDKIIATDTRITQKQNRHPPWMIWVVLGIVVVLIFKIRIR